MDLTGNKKEDPENLLGIHGREPHFIDTVGFDLEDTMPFANSCNFGNPFHILYIHPVYR